MTAPLHFHTITELAPLIAAGHLSSEALTRACLAEIEAHDRALNAFIAVLGASALAEARERDAEIAAGRCRGPLHGIPISLKDLIDVAGVATTAWAADWSCPAKLAALTATTRAPAATPAAIPAAESSMTRHSAGDTPSRSAASR